MHYLLLKLQNQRFEGSEGPSTPPAKSRNFASFSSSVPLWNLELLPVSIPVGLKELGLMEAGGKGGGAAFVLSFGLLLISWAAVRATGAD